PVIGKAPCGSTRTRGTRGRSPARSSTFATQISRPTGAPARENTFTCGDASSAARPGIRNAARRATQGGGEGMLRLLVSCRRRALLAAIWGLFLAIWLAPAGAPTPAWAAEVPPVLRQAMRVRRVLQGVGWVELDERESRSQQQGLRDGSR